ncbi:MAG TPA: DUF402 domain-containing protein [Bacillota bacterium]|nr:DUF402 domain-containing protein [Bacillota bacterium]
MHRNVCEGFEKEVIRIKPCIERKKYISGVEERFVCEWIAQEQNFGILKHTAEAEYRLGNMTVVPGNISYRFHWPSRSYNLCKLYNSKGELLGNVFNLADSVGVTDEEVSWRDLNVDIVVFPDGEAQVIDGEDRPALNETWLHIFIEANKQELLRKYRDVITETDKLLLKYQAG